MQCQEIIERGSKIILRNLNINSTNTTKDKWVSGTGYGFYSIPYEKKLEKDRRYYCRFTYKYTTTNQRPTWCSYYYQGGMNTVTGIPNMNPNTESTASGIRSPSIIPYYTQMSGTLYNGPSNHISGVTSYAKNVLCYDITELEMLLIITGITDIKAWCDKNLDYVPKGVDYDVTNLIPKTPTETVIMNKGYIIADEFIETDGMTSKSTVKDTYFDNGSSISIYNNYGNGTVTHKRISAESQDSPFKQNHKYILQITTNGSATPGTGGFYAGHMAAKNKRFIETFVAKIPVGYTVNCHYNAQGNGSSVSFIGPHVGTGKWEEYKVFYKCGTGGSFSTGGHVALAAQSGYSNTSVTWYLAYVSNCEVTGNENLKYFGALNNFSMNRGIVTSKNFNNSLFLNGTCERASDPKFHYDKNDKVGNAYASIVQPVGSGIALSNWMPFDPTCKYKVSFWVKCKRDMKSFLTAIRMRTSNGTDITHTNSIYVSGTKTKLAADLKSGDTQVKLKSGSNWVVRSYSGLGFRSDDYTSYNNLGRFGTHIVSSVNGNTINLKSAYSGSTRKAGTTVVESYDGGCYPYPIGRGDLPTDNTWKYVEGYFGADIGSGWDGGGYAWQAIPSCVTEISLWLNIYYNDGTVPIKYCDIKVEKVSGSGSNMIKNIIIE